MRKDRETVAIIDIGSNAVRLLVYHDLCRVPVPMHTERNICGLGKTLGKTGLLNPEGVVSAMDSLARFSALIKAMRIKTVLTVGTAALREAKDGAKFVNTVKLKHGLHINIVSGEEEARLSALGVIANHGQVDGFIGDFGGGSLEIIGIENGKLTSQDSYPVGALRVLSHDSQKDRLAYIDLHLKNANLEQFKGRNFYILGGAWRSLARAHIFMEDYPIQVLDNYRMTGQEAARFADMVSKQNTKSLERMAGLPKRRVQDMPAAALVFKHVLDIAKPEQIIFSGTGLREGLMYDQLAPATKQMDPLISACREIAIETSRFSTERELIDLAKWILPLFPKADAAWLKTIQAAALLSDVGWFEHEDHRPKHAYNRVLNMPLYGLNHQRRAILAISEYVRHKGYLRKLGRGGKHETTEAAQKILTPSQRDEAVVLGLVMRLAYVLTGGALGLLKYAELSLTPKFFKLILKGKHTGLSGEIVEDLMQQIAQQIGREARVKIKA